jgi:catechol 2,3-dioxygenase-like lactoylglutathione lyase family enzyme
VGVEPVALVIDSVSPSALARFWARALRWDSRMTPSGDSELIPTDATSFRLVFRDGVEPKVAQNPIHFDLTSASLDEQRASVADLIAHGARPADVGQVGDEGHVVLADPEGNEFCVIEPGNRFLASCPRLGAVNCDGTKELGHFFGAVLGWPLVWDQDEETAIQAPTGDGPKITWSGPPLMAKAEHERIHFHVRPAAGTSADTAVRELLRKGATRLDLGGRGCVGAVALADVDGNQLCLVE